jgi:hypothetical protein
MSRPEPLDDGQLDLLLGAYRAPSLSAAFADRVIAEAAREDRPRTPSPSAVPPRRGRRPWTRRGLVAAFVAVNLVVASAIAATLSGHLPVFQHIATTAARLLHLSHRHDAPHPSGRTAHATPTHRHPAPAPSPASPPLPTVASTPADLFAERHPLMAMRHEAPAVVRMQRVRRAILFSRHHPVAARLLEHRAHAAEIGAVKRADVRADLPMREGHLMPAHRLSPEGAPLPRSELPGDGHQRLDDRAAFERERRELEQRANAEWPARPRELHENSPQLRDKPAARAEQNKDRPIKPRQQWRERARGRRLGRHRPV